MRVGEIYKVLDQISPFCEQESWDNSGLLVGSFYDEVEQIYLSIDVDSQMIENIKPNSLIVSHHPIIFKGLKSIDFNTYPSSVIAKMIKKNISLISMHTNYDKNILNEYFVKDILGYKDYEKDGFIIKIKVKSNFSEICSLVKQALGIENLKVVYSKESINKIAVCTGSGMDLVENLDADLFLTGDIKYHQAFYAKENKLNLIDINHYESERYFGDSLAPYLQNLKIKVIILNSNNPFTYR